MSKCKHEWFFVREFYLDDLGKLTWRKSLSSGTYCKFICQKCGKVKYVKEEEE